MLTKRIIPCLDVKDGRVVKGVKFQGLSDVSSPVELADYYSRSGADELVFYDITASAEGRKLFTDILTEAASKIFIPLTVGGGISTLEDFDRVLKCGADKVSVNSGAIADPSIIPRAAEKYGNQCVVISADVSLIDGVYRVFTKGARENTGMEAVSWIKSCVDNGAGEVVLNSIDTDGVKGGFDIDMLRALNPEYRRDVVPGTTKPAAIKMAMGDVTRFIHNEDSIYNYNVNELLSKRDEVSIDDTPTFTTYKKKTKKSRRTTVRKSRKTTKKATARRTAAKKSTAKKKTSAKKKTTAKKASSRKKRR